MGVFIGLDIGVVIWSRGRCVTAWLGSGAGSVEQVEAGVRLRGDCEQIETSNSRVPDSIRQNGCIQEGSIKTLLGVIQSTKGTINKRSNSYKA